MIFLTALLSFAKTYLLPILEKNWRYILIGILCSVIGFKVHSCTYHCPEIAAVTTTVKYDTIYSHDTVRIALGPQQTTVVPVVTFHKQIEPVIQPATIHDTVRAPVILPETSFCYQTVTKMPDSALIGVKGCSRILPMVLPPDWQWNVWYVAPPKIKEVETIKIQYVTNKVLWYSHWWLWLPVTVATGVLAYHYR